MRIALLLGSCAADGTHAHAILLSHSDDLITKLVNDPENKDLWETQLLGNQFAKDMATTGPYDKDCAAVLAGFRAYMIVSGLATELCERDSPCVQQDYLYAISGITFQSKRLPNAISAKGIDSSLSTISAFCGYSKDVLTRCLAIPDTEEGQIIKAEPTDVLKKYIENQLAAAGDNDWVMSLVAIIPCIVVSLV